MANGSAFHGFVELTKDLFVLLREILIATLLVLLLFMPHTFKTLLERVGISKVATPFGDIDVKNTGGRVANLSRGIVDSVALLQQIQGETTDPVKRQKLQDLTTSLQSLQKQAHDADSDVKALVSQQAALQQGSAQSAPTSGWVFLGQVDDKKQNWSGEGAKNISPTFPPTFKAGDRFDLAPESGSAYLYGDDASGRHSEGTVAGVLPAGTRVQVIAGPEYQKALAGGYFLWVKVSRS